MQGAISRLHQAKKDYPVIAATNLFAEIINRPKPKILLRDTGPCLDAG